MLNIYARTFMIATRTHPMEVSLEPPRRWGSRSLLTRALSWLAT